LNCLKQQIIQSCETYTYPINSINLAQTEERSLRREEPLAQATISRLGKIAYRGHIKISLKLAHLAQASPSHSSEIALTQASGLRLGESTKQKEGELLLFSLRRELLVWAKNSSLTRA